MNVLKFLDETYTLDPPPTYRESAGLRGESGKHASLVRKLSVIACTDDRGVSSQGDHVIRLYTDMTVVGSCYRFDLL